MAYKYPVRSYATLRPRTQTQAPAPSIFDAARGISSLNQLLQDLDRVKANHEGAIAELITNAKQQITAEIEKMRAMRKGDKGDIPLEGVHYHVPTREEIVRDVMAMLRQPNDGKDADEKAIEQRVLAQLPDVPTAGEVADLVLEMIIVPEGEKGKDADPTGIIEQVVRRLTDGNTLKPEHIAGLTDKLKASQQGSGFVRGGGDTVVAGSGISITKNTAGRKVITASGGGFTTLTATETPNGNVTVFTFAAATAQPSFIIVDNVWLRATTKGGTVNWTWNAGTKKATLSVAATDEILGIV